MTFRVGEVKFQIFHRCLLSAKEMILLFLRPLCRFSTWCQNMPVGDHHGIADLTENAAEFLIQVVSSSALLSGIPGFKGLGTTLS